MGPALLNGGPRPAQMVLSQPLNDVQLVAWVAAMVTMPAECGPAERVAYAMELVAEAIVQAPNMVGMIRAKQQAASVRQ